MNFPYPLGWILWWDLFECPRGDPLGELFLLKIGDSGGPLGDPGLELFLWGIQALELSINLFLEN